MHIQKAHIRLVREVMVNHWKQKGYVKFFRLPQLFEGETQMKTVDMAFNWTLSLYLKLGLGIKLDE